MTRLSGQAKEAFDRAVQNIEDNSASQPARARILPERDGDDSVALITLAHRLGLTTEGRTAKQISGDIAALSLKAARPPGSVTPGSTT